MVFPDTSGSFTNDTECVNGPRGSCRRPPHQRGCALCDLEFRGQRRRRPVGPGRMVVRGYLLAHARRQAPRMCSARSSPWTDSSARTPGRRSRPSPASSAATPTPGRRSIRGPSWRRAGTIDGMAAWVGVSDEIPTVHRRGRRGFSADPSRSSDWNTFSEDHDTAGQLCELLSAHRRVLRRGILRRSRLPLRRKRIREALPWLAGRLNTPGVPSPALPGANPDGARPRALIQANRGSGCHIQAVHVPDIGMTTRRSAARDSGEAVGLRAEQPRGGCRQLGVASSSVRSPSSVVASTCRPPPGADRSAATVSGSHSTGTDEDAPRRGTHAFAVVGDPPRRRRRSPRPRPWRRPVGSGCPRCQDRRCPRRRRSATARRRAPRRGVVCGLPTHGDQPGRGDRLGQSPSSPGQ